MTDEFGVDWERWSDGRIWQLKRKRDFADVDARRIKKAATTAAQAMGKVVRTCPDGAARDKYLWVQFADHEIRIGDPCPCGGRKLLREHRYFARCTTCNARLALSRSSVAAAEPDERDSLSDSDDGDAGDDAAYTLEDFSDVHLERMGRSRGHEVYRGYGRRDGLIVLLTVEFLVAEGSTLDPASAADQVRALHPVPVHDAHGANITTSMRSWDLVL